MLFLAASPFLLLLLLLLLSLLLLQLLFLGAPTAPSHHPIQPTRKADSDRVPLSPPTKRGNVCVCVCVTETETETEREKERETGTGTGTGTDRWK